MNPLPATSDHRPPARRDLPSRRPPDLFQVVIECQGEHQQRELYERLRREGLRLRLLVL